MLLLFNTYIYDIVVKLQWRNGNTMDLEIINNKILLVSHKRRYVAAVWTFRLHYHAKQNRGNLLPVCIKHDEK